MSLRALRGAGPLDGRKGIAGQARRPTTDQRGAFLPAPPIRDEALGFLPGRAVWASVPSPRPTGLAR